MIDEKQREFGRIIEGLTGRLITQVSYYDIPGEDGESTWNPNVKDFDIIAFGVQLELDNGQSVAITWSEDFVRYGLMVLNRSLQSYWDYAVSLDVSVQSRWSHLLRKEISEVIVYWHTLIESGLTLNYPQDLEIRFWSGEKVFICARTYVEKTKQLFPFSDEIIVIFDDEIAKIYNIGPYARTN